MRKSLLLVSLVLLLIGVAAVPVAADAHTNGATKTVYYGCEIFGEPSFTPETTVRFSGNTVHIRGLVADAQEFIWDGSSWSEAGTNSTVWNLNAKGTPDDPFFFGWSDIFLWGTFHIDLNQFGFDIGEYTGHWRLHADDDPYTGADTARGTEVGGDRLSKDDLDPDPAEFPEGSLALLPEGCGPIMITIIDPGK